MSRSSALSGAVIATVAGALLLVGCGGGGSGESGPDPSSGTTTPAVTAAPATAGSSASQSPEQSPERPSTALPKGLRLTFDWPGTGDPTKDAVLRDGEQYVLGLNRAAALSDAKDPAYRFYSRDQGLSYARTQIDANISGGWVPTGLDRYYRAHVALVRAGTATLSYCEDQGKAYSKEAKTGRIDVTTPSANSLVLYNVLFVKDADSHGVWQASHVVVAEKAVAQCSG